MHGFMIIFYIFEITRISLQCFFKYRQLEQETLDYYLYTDLLSYSVPALQLPIQGMNPEGKK
jgi:hypothetical protein